MNEENAQFNGNLALLRVCAIMLIVGALHKTLGLSWTLLMSEANDDTLSWAYVPFGLLVAVLGVVSLVKKNTLIIFEGIEKEHQVDFCREHGVERIQGYYYSKPVSRTDFVDLYQGRRKKDPYE